MSAKPKSYRDALPPGHELLWYRVREVLGQGAFGITYLCAESAGEELFAVKEYLPPQVARRQSDQHLEPLSEALEEDFRHGLERFIAEAENLDRFKHPNVVDVVDIFEANNTAYLVMRYEQGESLHSLLSRRVTVREHELLHALHPLLDGLELIHGKGYVHRDVKPSNIFIRRDGSPVLLDFGSARQTLHMGSETVTNLVSPGYAPIEQYSSNAEKQGPWSDIYALGATLYRAVTGELPAQAIARAEALVHGCPDPYVPASEQARGGYSEALLSAVDHALAFKARFRPQSIEAWRSAFDGCNPAAPVPGIPVQAREAPPVAALHVPAARAVRGTAGAERTRGRFRTRDMRPWARELLRAAAVVLVLIDLIWSLAPARQATPPLAARTAAEVRQEPPAADRSVVVTLPPVVGLEPLGAPIEPPLAPQGEVKAAEAPPPTLPSPRETIDRLLAQAASDLSAHRLSLPAGNNALERYRQVLLIEPHNPAAARGIQSIVLTYLNMAYREMEASKLDPAGDYLRRAASIAPADRDVLRAQRYLYARLQGVGSNGVQPEAEAPGMARERARAQRVAERARARIEDRRRRTAGEL